MQFGDDSTCLNDLNHLIYQGVEQKLTRVILNSFLCSIAKFHKQMSQNKPFVLATSSTLLSWLKFFLTIELFVHRYQAPYQVEQPKPQYNYQPQGQPRQAAARPAYNAVNEGDEKNKLKLPDPMGLLFVINTWEFCDF